MKGKWEKDDAAKTFGAVLEEGIDARGRRKTDDPGRAGDEVAEQDETT